MIGCVKFWIWLSAWASATGWALSALGRLNRAGYLVAAVLGLGFWVWTRTRRAPSSASRSAARRSGLCGVRPRRFRRWLPLSFVVFSALVLLSGLLYAPSNHTGLSYRIPRVLHWLAEEGWHWIHTPNYRMNNRACGMEWLSAPLLAFTGSDRALFLLNFAPFLLLPGLCFSVFTRLGVAPRVAWRWMWLLPTGYSFLLQAGGIGNDAFPTVYALAAVDFALRARVSGRFSDAAASALAAALLTGAKASNLPLLLPWAVAFWGARRAALARPIAAGATALLALLVSFVPTAALNVAHCGDWSGLVLERAGMNMKQPLVGLWGNALLLFSNNFAPPFFPWAGGYNARVLEALPSFIVRPMTANFEQSFERLWELPTEDWAGLGFGVSALALLGTLAALRAGGLRLWPGAGNVRAQTQGAIGPGWMRRGVMAGAWVALAVYAMKSGMVTPARLITPYYPLLLVGPLALAGQARVMRRRWWRAAEVGVLLIALGVLVVTPPRPLWPAKTVLSRLVAARPDSALLRRALTVYEVYAVRPDCLAAVRAVLPPGLRVVGFIATGDDLDISLWRPYGSRRVRHYHLDDPVARLRAEGVEWVVVGGLHLKLENRALESWLAETGGELVTTLTLTVKASEGPQPWHVVRLPPAR
jgi:hypothetical protein